MGVEEAFVDSGTRARVVGGALAAAGVLGLAAAVLPGQAHGGRAGVAATGAGLVAVSRLARPLATRFPANGLVTVAGAAGLLVAGGALLAGGGVASAAFGFLLCWPVLSAAAVVDWRRAVALAAGASVLYGGALALRGVDAWLWAWVALSATLVGGGAAVSLLGSRVSHLASTDTRTGAVSSRFWEAMVVRECARSARSGHPLCVAVVSVDGLDDYHRRGHMAGEQFLRATAGAWQGALRGGDLLTHLQADEFGILLPECGDAAARTVVDRLRHATPDGRTSSAGIAMWTGQEPAGLLVNRACDALRDARAAGRDQSHIAAA